MFATPLCTIHKVFSTMKRMPIDAEKLERTIRQASEQAKNIMTNKHRTQMIKSYYIKPVRTVKIPESSPVVDLSKYEKFKNNPKNQNTEPWLMKPK